MKLGQRRGRRADRQEALKTLKAREPTMDGYFYASDCVGFLRGLPLAIECFDQLVKDEGPGGSGRLIISEGLLVGVRISSFLVLMEDDATTLGGSIPGATIFWTEWFRSLVEYYV